VLRADGSIGGFSSPSGVAEKKRMLRLEGCDALWRVGMRSRGRAGGSPGHAGRFTCHDRSAGQRSAVAEQRPALRDYPTNLRVRRFLHRLIVPRGKRSFWTPCRYSP